jgi:hypothetical protein
MNKANKIYSIKACFLTLFLLLVSAHVVQATSAVYYLPLQRAFSPFPVDTCDNQTAYLAVGPFGSFRNQDTEVEGKLAYEDHLSMGGAYFNSRFTYDNCFMPLWFEVRTAVAHESHSFGERRCQTECDTDCGSINIPKRSRTGFDDVVLTLGSTWFVNDCIQLVPYIFGGIPTKTHVEEYDVNGILVGTRYYAFGGGCEGAFVLWNDNTQAVNLITNLRLFHRFARDFQPVLPEGHRMHGGNQFDALVGLRWENSCFFVEGGYNPTVLFGHCSTDAEGKVVEETTELTSNVSNLYLMGGCKSEICGYSVGLTIGGSLGLHHKGHQKDGGVWLSGSISF